MKFVLNRDKVLVSMFGHVIAFKKDVPTYVPKALWVEATAIGALPEEEMPEGEDGDKAPELTEEERKEKAFAAFKALVLRNERGDFSPTGVPSPKAFKELSGLSLAPKEREKFWSEYQSLKVTGDE